MKWAILNILLVATLITSLYLPFSQTIENNGNKGLAISKTRTEEQLELSSREYISQNKDSFSNLRKHPSTFQNNGNPRPVKFTWQNSEHFLNQNNPTDIFIFDKIGMMYKENLEFAAIEASPIIIAVEDYDPFLSPETDFVQKTETLYMGFQINGSQDVKINGFWIYLRGESEGNIRFQVYSAIQGVESVTAPNASAPLSQETDVQIAPNVLLGEERWIWLEVTETLIINPIDTYANTFYLGISRANQDDSKINWVCCSDDSSPDNYDEGDAYSYVLDFSYLEKDFFLNCSISPTSDSPYPSDINLKVNNTVVMDQSISGIGRWESDEFIPAINMTNNNISLSIMYSWSDFYQWEIIYDVSWHGFFYENNMVETEFQVDVNQTTTYWTISFVGQYPSDSENQIMNISIEEGWTVSSVLRNTFVHSNWTEFPCNLLIQDAKDGIWTLGCISQNSLIEVALLDMENRTITQLYFNQEIKICCKIYETNGKEVSNGFASLYIFDSNEIEVFRELDCLIDNSSEYSAIFLWNIFSEYQIEGNHIFSIIWSNGTQAGISSSTIFIKSPMSPLRKIFTYLGGISLGALISVSFVFLIRQRYYIPRKRANLLRLKTMMNKYQDTMKLTRLLIIHKKSGLCFLDPMTKEKKIDANLVAGLLHAFSSFGGNLLEENSLVTKQEGETILQHLNYIDHHIIMFDGQFIRIAAIYTSIPSENITNQLKEFSENFEKQFYEELNQWTGDLEKFTSAMELIEKEFVFSLNLPHKVEIIESNEGELRKLEKEIYNYSLKLLETRNFFYLDDLLNNYKDKKERKILNAFNAIISLRQKGILFSINIEKG